MQMLSSVSYLEPNFLLSMKDVFDETSSSGSPIK